jgi:pSer/pThr/pTyr-binding forkhead associated (FHA) protein
MNDKKLSDISSLHFGDLKKWEAPRGVFCSPNGFDLEDWLRVESIGSPFHFTIGRSYNDLILYEPTVSRNHCELKWIGPGWFISDLNSKNGTKVNGNKILEIQIYVGDIIELGSVKILLK